MSSIIFKIFQVVLASLAVIFTISGLALLLSGLSAMLRFTAADGNGGITAVAGGFSLRWIEPIIVAIALLLIGVYALWRWWTLRR